MLKLLKAKEVVEDEVVEEVALEEFDRVEELEREERVREMEERFERRSREEQERIKTSTPSKGKQIPKFTIRLQNKAKIITNSDLSSSS